jgi:hypothetical protein
MKIEHVCLVWALCAVLTGACTALVTHQYTQKRAVHPSWEVTGESLYLSAFVECEVAVVEDEHPPIWEWYVKLDDQVKDRGYAPDRGKAKLDCEDSMREIIGADNLPAASADAGPTFDGGV